MLTDASKELREIEARIGELLERRIAAEDLLKRIHLRAPQSGMVHDLSVHTVGGVIGPGETVMLIVPNQDVLSVEVRIATSDIDQVHVGQEATLRFPAFNQRTTPEINGTVTRVGADLTQGGADQLGVLHGAHQRRRPGHVAPSSWCRACRSRRSSPPASGRRCPTWCGR